MREGLRGVLLTCSVGHEHKASTEVRHALEEHWTQLNPDANKDDDDDDNADDDEKATNFNDFSSALESDLVRVRALGKSGDSHFSSLATGVGGVAFLRCLDDAIELVPFVRDLMRAAIVRPSTRFTNMLIPVQRVCRADLDDVAAELKPLIDAVFNDANAPAQRWALVWKTHNCGGMPDKYAAAKRIAPLVDARHKVSLDAPDTAVVVHAVRAHAYIAILPDYQELREYFISRIVDANAKQTPTNETDDD